MGIGQEFNHPTVLQTYPVELMRRRRDNAATRCRVAQLKLARRDVGY
jgi:hypothetical protein